MNTITKATIGALALLCVITSTNSYAGTSGVIRLFGIVREKTSMTGINSETAISVSSTDSTVGNVTVGSNSDSTTNKLTVVPSTDNPSYTILINGRPQTSEIQTGTVQLAVALNPATTNQEPAFNDKWTVQLANL
jgi:hypothetical protein